MVRRTVVNRTLLGILGVASLVGGLLALIGGLELERRWGFTLPSWWPLDDPSQPLLSEADRTRWRGESWWWPAVFAVLGALTLGTLWWLVAQLRQGRPREVLVPVPEGEYQDGGPGAARVRARAFEDALAAGIVAMDGVDEARVTVYGARRSPRARITVKLAAHADPDLLLQRIDQEPLDHAKRSAGLAELPTVVRMRTDHHPASRVD